MTSQKNTVSSDYRDPGIGRFLYIIGPLIGLIPLLLAVELFKHPNDGMPAAVVVLLYYILFLLVWPILRLHNIGKSGWWVLLLFVPLANLYIGFLCIVAPAGYAHSKQLDTAGIILSILLLVPMILVLGLLLFGAML